jgi:GNAT superfamily N-acetyltransferase
MSTPPITIQTATESDAPQVFELTAQFATSFVTDRAAFDESFGKLLNNPGVSFTVARNSFDDAVIGYCLAFVHDTLFANGPVAWVEEITVREDFRRQGIGQALMQHAEDWAKSRNAALVGLMTRRAAQFYNAIGYEESATYFRKLL